jgi:Tfp pilus assembly protein PilO
MKQISLKDPLAQIVIIILSVGFVTYMAAQKLILQPNKNKIINLKAKIEHIKTENEIAQIHKEINSFEKSLPPQNDQSWLLTQITDMAKQSGIDIENAEPLPAKQIPPYSYVPFKIKTTCTFDELVLFVKLIETRPYILNLESLKIESDDKRAEEKQKDQLNQKKSAKVEIVVGTIY